MGKRMKINRRLLDNDDPRKIVQMKPYVNQKTGEQWKLLPGYQNVLVSDLGRVKVNGKMKKQQADKDGYLRVGIENNVKSWQKVHRLVAQTFLENPDNLPVVDHINGDKQDNRKINLRFCSVAQNTQWGYDLGHAGNNKTKMILAIHKDTKKVKIYKSQAEAARQIGIGSSDIASVIDRPPLSRAGYMFFRLKDIDFANTFGNDLYGETERGGVWAEHGENGLKVRVVDDREEHMTQPAVKELVCKLFNDVKGG